MADVKIVKLITGEDILANVDDVFDTNDVVLSKPMLLIPQQNGLQMVPWLMFAKKEIVTINKANIIAIFEPRSELADGYRQQTGGLVVAPAGAINKEGKLIL